MRDLLVFAGAHNARLRKLLMRSEMIIDNYMKYVVTTDYLLQKRNGIKHINILEFMKEGKKF